MNSKPSGKAPGGRFQTPEHLDRALYVTTPKAWLALLVLTVIVGAAVAWSIMGKVSSYVQAEGIVLSRGGMIVDAASSAGGTLSRILPSVGDTVIEGELVAEVSDAETMARYVSAVSLAEEWAQILKDREAEAKEENALAAENIARERARLDELERTGRERVNKIRERLRQNEDLLARGITNLATIERGEQALDLARRNLFDALHRRDEMEAAHLRRANDLKARVAEAKAEQVAARHRVNEFATLIESWHIKAPASGRVTEIKAQPGATLEPGDPVLDIETGRESVDVLFYVSPADGKRIEAGMPALVTPATVKREEYGSMSGTVESLSEFPSSLAGMVVVLKNRELAMSFSRNGAPYTGRVALTLDPSTVSGFAWTSPQAKDVDITPGTLATIEVEVAKRPPAALVVPWFAEKLGL